MQGKAEGLGRRVRQSGEGGRFDHLIHLGQKGLAAGEGGGLGRRAKAAGNHAMRCFGGGTGRI